MSTTLTAPDSAAFRLLAGDFVEVSGDGSVVVNIPGAEARAKIRAGGSTVGPFLLDGDCVITPGATPVTYTVHRERETRGPLPVTYDPDTATLIAGGQPITIGGDGSGDVVGPASSTNGELPLFSGTSGKAIKRSNTLSGLVKLTSGVVSEAEAGVDYAEPGGSSNAYYPAGW